MNVVTMKMKLLFLLLPFLICSHLSGQKWVTATILENGAMIPYEGYIDIRTSYSGDLKTKNYHCCSSSNQTWLTHQKVYRKEPKRVEKTTLSFYGRNAVFRTHIYIDYSYTFSGKLRRINLDSNSTWGKISIIYHYDSTGQLTSLARWHKGFMSGNTLLYEIDLEYDEKGRICGYQRELKDAQKFSLDQRASRTYSSHADSEIIHSSVTLIDTQHNHTFEYNGMVVYSKEGKLLSVQWNDNDGIPIESSSYSYYPNGQLSKRLDLPVGLEEPYTTCYYYNQNGHIKKMVFYDDQKEGVGYIEFAYDSHQRLKRISYSIDPKPENHKFAGYIIAQHLLTHLELPHPEKDILHL